MTSRVLLCPSLSHTLPYRAESVRSRGYAHLEPVPHQDHILDIQDLWMCCPNGQEWIPGPACVTFLVHSSSREHTLLWVCTSLVAARSNQSAANRGCASSFVVMEESWHGKRNGVWPLPEIRSQKLVYHQLLVQNPEESTIFKSKSDLPSQHWGILVKFGW